MLLIFLELLFLFNVSGQLCDEKNTVDLTNAKISDKGVLISDGVKFSPAFVYTNNDTGILKTYGCLCTGKQCFRKCCPFGQIFSLINREKKCIKYHDILQTQGLNVSFQDSYKNRIDIANSRDIFMLYGQPCNGDVYIEEQGLWFVQQDGNLYVKTPNTIPPFLLYGPDKYCVDTFITNDKNGIETTSFDALICFNEDEETDQNLFSTICMLISCVFILATVAVYGWLPELRNLHGRVLMAYLLCLFVGFAFLAAMQILLAVNNISNYCCVGFTIIIYFALESAFFWLNVMCFDIWWTFSGKRGTNLEKLSVRGKFFAYSIYAFGIPTALTVIMTALEFSGLPPHVLLPMIMRQGCFLFGYSKLFYLYGPIVILWFANLIFFILTAVKIGQIKKQTSVLKSRESATHNQQNSEKQRLFLYVKLFIVMGINWLLEVISALYPEADQIWRFTDAYNVLIGLIVFIIFVCKRKIFRLMKKRIKDGIQNRNGAIGSITHLPRIQTNLQEYKQRDSLETIRTYCPDSDSNKEINTTSL